MLLGVKQNTNAHCLLRETGQMPEYFYWFAVLLASGSLLAPDNALLSNINEADLLQAHRKVSWTFAVLSGLAKYLKPRCTPLLPRAPPKSTSDFEPLLRMQNYENGEIWARFIHMMRMFPADL